MSDFIELTNVCNNDQFLLNIKKIKTVVPENDVTDIYVDNEIYFVRESYDEIKKMIIKCGALEDDLK